MAFILTTQIDADIWYWTGTSWTRRRDQAREYDTASEAAQVRDQIVVVTVQEARAEAAAPA